MTDNRGPGLTYHLPEPAKPHTVLHIPGSHTVYVGPRSCTRRHAIHALEHGDRRDVSFLFVSEADVISGTYEELMVTSIGDLMEVLDPVPHIFIIAVFCIDDFLGTDEEALLETLRKTYPDRQFAFQHIDPVSMSSRKNMGMRKYEAMYAFISEPKKKDKGINFIGHFTSLEPECEFLTLIGSWGMGPVRELFNCRTYEEFQEMGQSRMSVVFRHIGKLGAQYLTDHYDIPNYMFLPNFGAEEVARGYNEIEEILGKEKTDFTPEIERAMMRGKAAAEALGGLPIAVDSSASLTPFSVAKALLAYGFNVKYIFKSNHAFKLDPEEESFIVEKHPEIIITRSEDYVHLGGDIQNENCLAIGADCARVMRARHFADIWHDEGYFGFHGIHKLMDTIEQAAAVDMDWEKVPQLTGHKKHRKGGK